MNKGMERLTVVKASGLAWYLSRSLMMRTCPCCEAWCSGVSPNCTQTFNPFNPLNPLLSLHTSTILTELSVTRQYIKQCDDGTLMVHCYTGTASWVACPPIKPLQCHRHATHHRPVNHRHTTVRVWQCESVITSECLAPATCNSGLITPSQTSPLLKKNLLQARSHS